MSYLPITGRDVECCIASWPDGSPIDVVRFTNNQMSMENDVVLLYSATKLAMDHFPPPRAFHKPPNNSITTAVPERLHSLVYNGLPGPNEDTDMYPNTPKDAILSAYANLHPDCLSWTCGPSETSRYDANVVFYRISVFCGASGGGVFDEEGRLVGSFLLS